MKKQFLAKGELAMRPEAVGLVWPQAPRDTQMCGSVAVISVCGPLEHQKSPWFDSYESILSRFMGAMCDEDVTSIVLRIDSPGGEVSGLQETVRRMRDARQTYDKPVIAFADEEAYSAAYAISCACDEVYIPESGGVGSVGVLATLCDRTEATREAGLRVEVVRSGTRKAEGHPDIPLTDSVLLHTQQRVDALAKQFFRLVAEVRPTNRKALEALQGQCLYGQKAVDAGLADGVLSFDQVLSGIDGYEKSIDNDSGSGRIRSDDYFQSDGGAMKPFAVLEKLVAEAIKAVMAAKNPADRKVAVAALAKAQASLTEAKVKKTYNKKTTTVEEESEEDDGSEDGEESEEDDDDDDDSDGDDPPPSSKKGKKMDSLSSFVKSLTGQSSSLAAQQVLASMHEQAQANAANAEKIANLEAAAKASQVSALVTEGVSAGKIKPAQLAWAKTLSLKDLKAYLAATPALFSPRQAPPETEKSAEATEEVDADGLTASEKKICQMSGVTFESYKKQKALGLPKIGTGN